MSDGEDFKKAAENVRNLGKTPSNDEYATLYSLYKQATVGDCGTERPGITDQKGRVKYDAWISRKGMTSDDAAKMYIDEAKSAVDKFGLK